MSRDHYECDSCPFGFDSMDENAVWCECGGRFCSQKCAQITNYGEYSEETESHRIDPDQEITCVLCRKEQFTSDTLLVALMKHFNLTHEQVVEIAKKQD